MSLANRVAFMSTLAKDHVTGGKHPLVVVLNTTHRCNIACGYCYGQYPYQKKQNFTTEELLGLIGELGRLGAKSFTLGGGEPLMRDDIGLAIRKVKEAGAECGMNTNGILIPKRLEELKAIDMVTVSLDGPEEMNDPNRGKGTFKKIMAGIDAALENGIKVHTTAVITKHNVGAIDWMVQMSREKGIQTEFNLLFHQATGHHDSDDFAAENELMKQAVARIAEYKEQGAPILFSRKTYRYVSQWPDYRQRVVYGRLPQFDYQPCYAGRFMIFIDADGKFYPCVQLIDTFQGLDFREVGVQKAYDHCLPNPCKACYFPCFTEFNYIMNLDPEVLAEQAYSTVRGH